MRIAQRRSEDWMAEASRLLEKAARLTGDKRRVYEYFVKNVSVGDIRAEMELSKLGVRNPGDVIEELIEEGLLERGVDCYNLAYPLRRYYASKRQV